MTIRDADGNVLGHKNLGSVHYEYDNYTGSQILLYFGDILIDDALDIRFNVQQTKTPVFGYANQYYTFVADGHVIVSGSLTVNFKEAGYLLWPIKEIVNRRTAGDFTSPRRPSKKYLSTNFNSSEQGPPAPGQSWPPSNFGSAVDISQAIKASQNQKFIKSNVEQAFAQSQSPEFKKSLNEFYRDLGSLPDDAFEAWAEEFEDVLWFGADPANAGLRSQLFTKNIRDGEEITKEDVWNHRRADQYPEIDILISYGDFSSNSHNHTVKKILDVTFTGQSKIIESSGQPILEEYNFIARNVV
jgi:hypothetical protein